MDTRTAMGFEHKRPSQPKQRIHARLRIFSTTSNTLAYSRAWERNTTPTTAPYLRAHRSASTRENRNAAPSCTSIALPRLPSPSMLVTKVFNRRISESRSRSFFFKSRRASFSRSTSAVSVCCCVPRERGGRGNLGGGGGGVDSSAEFEF